MNRNIEIALWTYLIPVASTRALRIGLVLLAMFIGLVFVLLLVSAAAKELAALALRGLGDWTIFPGLPLLAILLSEMPVRDGIRQKTLLYLLLGPVPRMTLYLVRCLASAVLLAAGTSLAVGLVRFLDGSGLDGLPGDLLAVWLGALAYVPLFGVLHTVMRRGLIGGLAIFALFDASLAKLPFALRNLSPAYHMQVLADQLTQLEGLPIPIQAPPTSTGLSALVLLLISAALTGLGAFLFSRKDLGEIC